LKKIIIISVILTVTAVSAFAERMILIQGTYLSTSRTYEFGATETKETYGEAGINFTSFTGQGLGFYSSATFLIPTSYKAEINGTEVSGYSIDAYDDLQLGLDMLLGVGFLAPITPNFSLLAAGGLHFNGIALLSSTYDIDPYLAYNLGPGVAVNALLYLTRSLNINISAMGAWDMFEFLHMPELNSATTAKGGFTWALSAGLGFAY